MTMHSKMVMMMMTPARDLEQCRKYIQKCHLSLFLYEIETWHFGGQFCYLKFLTLALKLQDCDKNHIIMVREKAKWLMMVLKILTNSIF